MDSLNFNNNQFHPDFDKEKIPIIESLHFSKGQKWTLDIKDNKVIFITSGILLISYDQVLYEKLAKGTIMLLTIGSRINVYVEENSSLIVIRLQYQSNNGEIILQKLLLEDIQEIKKRNNVHLHTNENQHPVSNRYLTIKYSVWTYLSNLEECMRDGLNSTPFFKLKLRELFLLFKTYYTKEELLFFFDSLKNYDHDFSSIIINNYRRVKTIKELAELTNYSVSGFEKRFKRIFGVSAGKWLIQQKTTNIYNELSFGDASFKSICFTKGFLSLSHFNNYCKLHFGKTPGQIRREGKNNRSGNRWIL